METAQEALLHQGGSYRGNSSNLRTIITYSNSIGLMGTLGAWSKIQPDRID